MKRFFLITVLFFIVPCSISQVNDLKKKDILNYAKRISDTGWNNYEEDIQKWIDDINLENIWGYRPPANVVYLAAVNGLLYEKTKDKNYGT